jgi:hypothetical protein
MKEQKKKLKQGFHCIKLKLGAIDFDKTIIELYSETFGPEKMEMSRC